MSTVLSEWLADNIPQGLRSTLGTFLVDGEKNRWAAVLTKAHEAVRATADSAESRLRAVLHYTTEHPVKVLLFLVAFVILVKMMICVIPTLVKMIVPVQPILVRKIGMIPVVMMRLVSSILAVMWVCVTFIVRCVGKLLGFSVTGPVAGLWCFVSSVCNWPMADMTCIIGSFASWWQASYYAGYIPL